jgi:putative hydrolase of the HAD superfamily
MSPYTHYLFDLGQVLFRINRSSPFEHWAAMTRTSAAELQRRFEDNPALPDFERGKISNLAFYERLCEHLGVRLTFEQFRTGWNSVYSDVIPETVSRLKKLKGKATCVAFTNTNAVHCEIWPYRYREELALFDRIFISSEIGLRKPDAEAFRFVLSSLGCEASNAVFIDDHLPNVEGARAVGIHAIQMNGPEDLENIPL